MGTANLAIPYVSANQNQKEVTINEGFDAVDGALCGYFPVVFTSNAATLTAAEFNGNYVFVTGSQTALATLTVPLSKREFVVDNSTGSFGVNVGGASGTVVTVPAGSLVDMVCDGTNVRAFTAVATTGVTSVAGRTGAVALSTADISGLGSIASQSAAAVAITGGTITGLSSPSAAADAATKGYVDATIQGLSIKPAAQVATTGALPANTYANGSSGVGATLTATANGALTVDGYAVSAGQRVLVKDEAAPANNGLYLVTAAGSSSAPYVLTRDPDMDAAGEINGSLLAVEQFGTTNASTLWLCTAATNVTVGTTAIPFTAVASPAAEAGVLSLAAGSGLAVNQATGAVTVSLAPVASGDVLANTSGGSAAPAATTLSALLDAVFGATQGEVLYRGASGWAALAPGSARQLLASGGASANPAWATQPYVVAGFVPGTLTASQVLLAHKFAGAVTFPANFGTAVSGEASSGDALANATAQATLTVSKCPAGTDPTVSPNWTQVGTIVFAAGGHSPTFASSGGTSVAFAQGDKLQVVAPGSADATLANVFLTLAGDR